jgi:putative sterol carrier protein
MVEGHVPQGVGVQVPPSAHRDVIPTRFFMDNGAKFPSPEWMQVIKEKLNTDEHYAQVAKNWEGDMRLIIDPDDTFSEGMWLYFDLWHGKCRDVYIEEQTSTNNPAFVLKAPYGNYIKILSGKVQVMTALMSRMISVKGSMAYMMRNVPTILDFVRCCQEITPSWK